MPSEHRYRLERRLLQICVLIGGCVPVFAGGAGMVFGTDILTHSQDVSLDSHFRYLSGLLFALGLCFWSFIPRIEQKTAEARLLAFLVVIGGAARLAALIFVGVPSIPMILAIVMELVLTPSLCLWQRRVSKL